MTHFNNCVANNASALAKWHTILHLNVTASSPYSLALLALLQPESSLLRSPQQLWLTAQSRVDGTTPPALVTVLGLPLHEALRCLSSLPPPLRLFPPWPNRSLSFMFTICTLVYSFTWSKLLPPLPFPPRHSNPSFPLLNLTTWVPTSKHPLLTRKSEA